MKTLPIVWQRLVSSGGTTCPRCQGTHDQVLSALQRLKAALQPLGVVPTLETREIDEAAFVQRPAESNRIWIAGKPMEAWLGASVGRSRCCNECGDNECRTLEVDGTSHEVIPGPLLIRAALIAASQGLDPTLQPGVHGDAGAAS